MIGRFFKHTQGAISLFLSIIMLANFVLSSIIVEGARLRMAKEIVQSAADSAAMSVIAKYDKQMYDRYGLFVMDIPEEQIYADFKNFFLANVSASLPDGDSFDELFSKLEEKYGATKEVKPFDLYDFQLDDGGVEPVYSIGNPTILQVQMTEFAKYRSVTRVLQDLSNFGENISENAAQQQKDIEIIQDSLEYKEQVQEAAKDLAEFTQKLSDFYMGNHDDGTITDVKKKNDNNQQVSPARLNEEQNRCKSEITEAIAHMESDFNYSVTTYNNLETAIDNYNELAEQIVRAEEELREDNADTSSGEDGESEPETIDTSQIDSDVNTLKNYLTQIEQYVQNFNNTCSRPESDKSDLQNKIQSWITIFEGWKTQLNGCISQFNTLKDEANAANNSAKDYRDNKVIGDSDVSETAKKEATNNINDLEDAIQMKNGQYVAITYLNNTLQDVDNLIEQVNELAEQVSNIKFENLEQITIEYVNINGTISALEQKAANEKNSESTDPFNGRPRWDNLSDMKISASGAPAISPGNIFADARNKVSSGIGGVKIRGNFYVYKSSIQKVDQSQCDDLKEESGGKFDKDKLKELYTSDDGDTSTGVGSEENGDSKGIGNGNISGIKSGLPSNNRSQYAIMGENFAGSKSTILNDFKNMKIDKTKQSQNDSYNTMDSFLSQVQSWFTGAQYDVMTYSYVMCMFNTRMTKSSQFVSYDGDKVKTNGNGDPEKGPSELCNEEPSSKPKWYVNRNPDDDLDLRFRPKSLNDTKLNSELEYIIMGQDTDESNTGYVWGTIFGIRMVNNLVALYTHETIHTTVQAIAAEIAAAIASVTFGAGTLLAPLIELAIMGVLAAVETYLDMELLVTKGYKVPFLKTKNNLNLVSDSTHPVESTPMVSYEDYLLIMLIFVGKENVLFRSADLIQMNMGSDYKLIDKRTYLKCSNTVSIKPLMVSYAFMPDNLKRDKRTQFTTTLYQGY